VQTDDCAHLIILIQIFFIVLVCLEEFVCSLFQRFVSITEQVPLHNYSRCINSKRL